MAQEGDTLIYQPSSDMPQEPRSEKDSLFIARHSPRTAVICSAILPGLGQVYNRKYWKVPIVYAGLGGFAYGVKFNDDRYKSYKDKYKYMLDNSLEEYEGITLKEAEFYKNYHKRYRDLFAILTAGFYILQVVDASVDASLIDYDISENLSLLIDPVVLPLQGKNHTFGLRCCLSF
jgi:hypothetical protein